MHPFDRVVLIFNPNSTENASGLAAELRDELAVRQPDLPVMLQQTEHAGHAVDLARDAALTGCPLLVSVSGDGGYNEVVKAPCGPVSEDDSRPDDGKFEVITVKHTAKWRLLGTAIKAAVRGLGPQPSVREYHFTNLKKMPIQVDGEVIELGAGAKTRIDRALMRPSKTGIAGRDRRCRRHSGS
jgi:diacylglycerol kinase family enzyme